MVRRFVSVLLVALLIAAALVARVGGPTAHAERDIDGTTKISQFNYPDPQQKKNEPHVLCQFYVLGFNLAAAQGNNNIVLVVRGAAPTLVVTNTYSGTPDGLGTYRFVNGPYYLGAGHYKSFATNAKGRRVTKETSFWVDGPCSPPPPPPPPSCGTQCGAPASVTVSHQSMHLASLKGH